MTTSHNEQHVKEAAERRRRFTVRLINPVRGVVMLEYDSATVPEAMRPRPGGVRMFCIHNDGGAEMRIEVTALE